MHLKQKPLRAMEVRKEPPKAELTGKSSPQRTLMYKYYVIVSSNLILCHGHISHHSWSG